jgi:hypothetical protein
VVFPVLILVTAGFGLAGVLAGVVCREKGPVGASDTRLVVGRTVQVLAGGTLLLGMLYRLSRWLPPQGGGLDALTPRVALFAVSCICAVAFATWLRAAARAAAASGPSYGPAVVGAGALTLALMSGFFIGHQVGIFNDQRPIEKPTVVAWGVPGIQLETEDPKPWTSAKNYGFRADYVKGVSNVWEAALARFKGKPHVRYLEVGVYEGRSFFWMAENILTHPTTHLTAIDIFSDPAYGSSYKETFYENLERSGFAGRVNVMEGFSQVELRKLPLGSYDFIYVDGSHNDRDVLEDAILCWRLLKDDGLLIFDDYKALPGVWRALDVFYLFFRDDFDVVHVGIQLILRKNTRDRSIPGRWD